MSSIPEDPADRFAIYRGLRLAGHSAEEIADRWEFGSPKALFRLLRQDGFPVCEKCGEYSKSSVCDEHKCKRKPLRSGAAEKLAPSANAADLFHPLVEELFAAVLSLHWRVERYRAGRFEKMDEYPLAGSLPLYREAMTEEAWRSLCEKYKQDPRQDSFGVPARLARNTVGAGPSPRETTLIAAYLLQEESRERSVEQTVEVLLEALHLDPDKADRQKLLYGNPKHPRQQPGEVEKLRRAARRVARLVRGAPIEGAPAEELTGEELNIAKYIREQLRAGRPYEEIKQELIDRSFEESQIDYVKSLNISLPN